MRMLLVAYCSRQRVDLWRKLEAEEEAARASADKAGEVAEASKDTPPEAGDP